jgi:putative tricarboxylic transport membrane protein
MTAADVPGITARLRRVIPPIGCYVTLPSPDVVEVEGIHLPGVTGSGGRAACSIMIERPADIGPWLRRACRPFTYGADAMLLMEAARWKLCAPRCQGSRPMPPSDKRSAARAGRLDWREVALGGGALALGIAVALVARGFPAGSAYDTLGPKLFPFIVAGGLVLTGAPILLRALLAGGGATGRPEPVDGWPVLMIAGALLVPVLLIGTIGWIPVAGVVFLIGARAFGSRRPLVDLLIGLAFGGATFVLFNHVLGLALPAGSLLQPLLAD